MFVTHTSRCYDRIKRHYRAIIHGPLVVFLQQINGSRETAGRRKQKIAAFDEKAAILGLERNQA